MDDSEFFHNWPPFWDKIHFTAAKYWSFIHWMCHGCKYFPKHTHIDYICAEWADGPRARDISFSWATKERGRAMFEGLGPSHTRHIHNFMTLEPFLRKSCQNVCIVWISRVFPNFREKNYDGEFLFENYFWQTGKKATSVVSEPRSESSSLGPIGTDFARKRVLLYEIDDEEVI